MEERVNTSNKYTDESDGINRNEVEEEIGVDNKQDIQPGLIDLIKLQMELPDIDVKTLSPLALAFIGDGVFDLVIRTLVVEKGNAPVNKMHKMASNMVKAPAQADLYKEIEDKLTKEEITIFKRGRNAKSYTSAKNASMSDYRMATGLEALIGYLYLTNQFPRILELIKLGYE